jgi:hypothetical protein
MLDLTSEFGKNVDKHLREEEVIWLTTVAPDNVSHPNPVTNVTQQQLAATYSVEIRIKPTRLRGM